MDIFKLKDAIAELEAEAERCTRIAGELKAVVQRSANGGGHPVIIQPRTPRAQQRFNLRSKEQKSVRTLALELLRDRGKPLHLTELVALINERREEPTNRAAVESQLVRALKNDKHNLKRTAPGTFAVTE